MQNYAKLCTMHKTAVTAILAQILTNVAFEIKETKMFHRYKSLVLGHILLVAPEQRYR